VTRLALSLSLSLSLSVSACALTHEIGVDANVDAGGSREVLAPCHSGEAGTSRECGWIDGGTVTCRPGTTVSVGCGTGCGLGTCSGDSMIRVCDSVPCTSSAALAADDDSCGSLCSLATGVRCPASGMLRVLTGPFSSGNAYTCSFVVR
jgi:hypothetical protein